jgi:glutathione S-transferase
MDQSQITSTAPGSSTPRKRRPIFRPTAPEAYKAISKENLTKRFDWLNKELAGRKFLLGDKITIADAYLFVVLRWRSSTNWCQQIGAHDRSVGVYAAPIPSNVRASKKR